MCDIFEYIPLLLLRVVPKTWWWQVINSCVFGLCSLPTEWFELPDGRGGHIGNLLDLAEALTSILIRLVVVIDVLYSHGPVNDILNVLVLVFDVHTLVNLVATGQSRFGSLAQKALQE